MPRRAWWVWKLSVAHVVGYVKEEVSDVLEAFLRRGGEEGKRGKEG